MKKSKFIDNQQYISIPKNTTNSHIQYTRPAERYYLWSSYAL